MRMGIALIWIWTAVVSWFFYPHTAALEWLRRLGITQRTDFIFAGACLADLALGMASAVFASRRLWQLQFSLVVFYSVVIAIKLPEFLVHPFGPIIKNIAVLACLAYLMGEDRTSPPTTIKRNSP
jgi:hypothetical protein